MNLVNPTETIELKHMNRHLLRIVAAWAVWLVGDAGATLISFEGLNRNIPDGSPVGLADTRTVSSSVTSLGDLNVWLNIAGRGSGGFNGDLYVTLVHETGFAVLLNRPGRQADNPLGYGDSGLNIMLDDEDSANVHQYRLTLSGNDRTRLNGPLTGTWQPDGRNIDPDQVLTTTPSTTPLSGFDSLNPNGAWTLYVADLEAGGLSRLESWGLDITGVDSTIPEPTTFVAGLALLVAALASIFQRRRDDSGLAGFLRGFFGPKPW